MTTNRNITSANSKVSMICLPYPAGVNFENYSTDTAWTADAVESIETRMGVDGIMSAGYTPVIKPIQFTFQPNSATLDSLNNIMQLQAQSQTPIWVQLTITLPSLNKTYACLNGIMKTEKLIPDAKKVLDLVSITFEFESIVSSPL